MALVDVLATALVFASGAAFIAGEAGLSRSADLRAIYWLTFGVVSLRTAVQLARSGPKE
jgi:hypothetical protein